MIIDQRPFTLDRIVRTGITIGIFYGFILLLDYLSGILIPFVIAALLAYLINPIVHFFEKKIKKRGLAIAITLLLFTIVFGGLAIIGIPIIIKEISHMGTLLANLVNNTDLSNQAQQYVPTDVQQWVINFANSEEVQNFFNADNLQNAAKQVLPGVWGIFESSISMLVSIVGLFIILLYLIFILVDYDKIIGNWESLLPPNIKDNVVTFVDDFSDGMRTYFRAQALIASIVGILFAIGFSIVGVPMGIAFGLFVGMLNMVPYLQNIAFIPAAGLVLMHSLETGDNFWAMFGFTIMVFVIVQLIQEAILTPRIMGDATGLNPAIILLSLSIWGKLLGLLGLLIALPLTGLIVSYYKKYLQRANETQPSTIIVDG